MSSQSEKEIFTRKEAAEYIGCCKTTLDQLNIPHFTSRRLVRYAKSDILDYLRTQAAKQTQTKGGKSE